MDCLFNRGAGYSDVFCRGKTTAEASGQATVAASASAHVVAKPAEATASGSADGTAGSSGASSGTTKDCGPLQPEALLCMILLVLAYFM